MRIPLLQPTARGAFARVEYLIRPARITDIERLVALSGGSVRSPGVAGSMDSGDLLRQLVYLPQASIFIAEARREVVGGAVLALRRDERLGEGGEVAPQLDAARARRILELVLAMGREEPDAPAGHLVLARRLDLLRLDLVVEVVLPDELAIERGHAPR